MATQTDASAVTGMAVDRVGNVFYSDSDGNRVRRIDARTGVVSTIAGNGIAGCSGDGELGLLGQLYLPQGVAVDGIGNVYVAATGNSQVRRIDAETGVMTTVLGDGTLDLDLRDLPINQERVAVNSPCPDPKYLALDGNQYLMVFDGENDNLLKLDLYTGKVVRWAGLKSSSNDNIGIPAENADLGGLVNFTVGPDHSVYFSHRADHSIRRIPAGERFGGPVQQIACDNSEPNFVGDNRESAATAECGKVTNLAVGAEGNIVFADAGNMRVPSCGILKSIQSGKSPPSSVTTCSPA
ncbi:MAG: hypothetical protein GY822_24580 [Deltaproteobacteria bacterium]|nr:hypothetical protein [Deltaproteobacteria bacterium]